MAHSKRFNYLILTTKYLTSIFCSYLLISFFIFCLTSKSQTSSIEYEAIYGKNWETRNFSSQWKDSKNFLVKSSALQTRVAFILRKPVQEKETLHAIEMESLAQQAKWQGAQSILSDRSYDFLNLPILSSKHHPPTALS